VVVVGRDKLYLSVSDECFALNVTFDKHMHIAVAVVVVVVVFAVLCWQDKRIREE